MFKYANEFIVVNDIEDNECLSIFIEKSNTIEESVIHMKALNKFLYNFQSKLDIEIHNVGGAIKFESKHIEVIISKLKENGFNKIRTNKLNISNFLYNHIQGESI